MKVLLVDDDATLRDIMRANFELVGFDVAETANPDEAIAALDGEQPDAIVLDVLPTASDGPAVVRRIRTHPRGGNVPLIVLTARADHGDAVHALEAGADDVLVKPFAPDEMLARVRGKIARARADAALQPLTGLPGNGSIESAIRERLARRAPWSVLYVDLDGFKRFNDAFGFAKGDDALRLLADVVVGAVRRHGGDDDFVGHVGGDDFVAVTTPARAEAIGEAVVSGFDRGIRGVQHDTRVPYCTVSIAVVSGSLEATTYERVGERAAAVKSAAKRRAGSVVVTEGTMRG